MDSEFVALAAAGKEVEWLRNLIHEIPIWLKPIALISIHCDSAATLAKAYSQIYNGKSRHLGVRHSMIRELIMNGVISIEFVRSQHNLAGHLTKALARDLFSHLFYADDVVFMGDWSEANIDTILRVLDCFYHASGLQINMLKSKLMGILVFSDKVDHAAKKKMCQFFQVPFSEVENLIYRGEATLLKSVLVAGTDLWDLHRKMGNGVDIQFWEDKWRGNNTFQSDFPRISKTGAECASIIFAREIYGGINSFRIEGYMDGWSLEVLWQVLIALRLGNSLTQTSLPNVSLPKTRWIKAAYKSQNSRLESEKNMESSSHIFFTCPISREIFHKVLLLWEIDVVMVSSYDEWLKWLLSIRLHSKHKELFEGAMAEEDAFLVDDVEGGLCVDNTNAKIDGICNSGSNKDKGKKDFKHTLKHGKDDLSLVQLGSHLRIEESLRAQESNKGKGKEVVGPSVNMMEEGGKNKNNKQNKGKKHGFKDNNGGFGSNKKPKLECWKCGKTGHFKRDCRSGNKKNNASASGSGKGSKDQSQDQGQNLVHVCNRFIKYSVSLISEAFYVQVDAIAWWIDSGAITHVCKDRCWFKTYEPVEDRSVLYMGDDHFAPVYGKGSVVLEFSSGKSITLFNVLYVPKLRHVHNKRMLEMSKDDLIPAIDENTEKCSTCMLTKITRQPFKSITRKFVILELIHSDLCDFHATPSLGNKKYVITFIDDASKFCYVYLLHAKNEALDKFRIYKTEVELQQNDLIKTLRIDRGGEYYDLVFFQSVGIIHKTTAPYTPQQNGMAERKNKALKEMVNSMLSYSGLSDGFWGEAMLTACYLLNRVSNKNNKTTPYELWFKKRPNLTFLRVWGCRAVVRLPNPKRKTLGEKESRDAIFDENRFFSIPRPKDIIPNSDESQMDDHLNDVPSETPETHKGKRVMKAKSYGSDFQLYLVEGSRDQIGSQYSYCYSIEEYPRTYSEVMQYRDSKHKVCKLVKSLYGLKQAPKHKFDGSGKGVIICLYVDDMLIFGTDQNQVDKTKKFLSSKFSMKDMGEADVILGIKIKCKPVDQLKYSRAIGCLMYAMTSTRPGIAYAVGRLSRFTSNPSRHHCHAIIRASKKQTCITGSTMKSEFVALAVAGKEAEWLRNMIHEILIWPKPIASISIHCDSAATLAKSYSQIYNVVMEYLVNISERHAFWSLNEDILKIYYSDNQYTISIKEDTAYPCLHSPKTTKE
ncbi:zinc finger, CCHC-type containing protein [Tanacetum coccineum]|uniref:Zinc finger, CCHC-type containing protein n=1 Tax=Tanacetum coccineum TaxID=301880 RepID=A0ABQ4XJA6_9ASTR